VNKQALAVLVNQLGGYDETEKAIGVDAELIARAVGGGRLSRLENAELETGFNQLYLEPKIANKFDIDLDDLDETAEILNDAENKIKDVDLENLLRSSLAEGEIETDNLESTDILFGNLTPLQRDRVLGIFTNIQDVKAKLNEPIPYSEKRELKQELSTTRQTVSKMFDALNDDIAQDRNLQDIYESAFWEWFREIFYPD
jgi:hypothetical protein